MSENNEKDMTKIVHNGRVGEGCATGVHRWSEKTDIKKGEGDNAIMTLQCVNCQATVKMDIDLQMNDVIDDMEKAVQDIAPINQPQPRVVAAPNIETSEETAQNEGTQQNQQVSDLLNK